MNSRDDKLGELIAKVDLLTAIILKARHYAQTDPEVALMQSRKSAEAICRQVFTAEIGDPGKMMLDELIHKLRPKRVIPPRILVPLGTIQAYGNFGVHAQADAASIDTDYVDACLSALATVTSWYFLDYLGIALPADISRSKQNVRSAPKDALVNAASPDAPPEGMAQLLDGSSVSYILDSCVEGAVKRVCFATDGKKVVKFFKSGSQDENRIHRLRSIISDFNPTLERSKGGAAPSARSAAYFRERYSWPEAIISLPTLGVLAPRYPEVFAFRSGRFAGREKTAQWFIRERLRRLLPEEEQGTLRQRIQVCISLARCVRRLHQAGLCHSDLSSHNVLVDFDSGNALVSDVEGLVVPHLFPPEVLGTPGYMAPELVAGIPLDSREQDFSLSKISQVSARLNISTDEHALAVLIYELLLQRNPLRGPRVCSHKSAEDDERLAMGEMALFIEDPSDTSNRPEDLSPPCSVFGPLMETLFEGAFVRGLHCPTARPSAYEWERVLVAVSEQLYPCGNPSCLAKWFVVNPLELSDPICPFCDFVGNSPIPSLILHDGNMKAVVPIWEGRALYEWHITGRHAGEEADYTPLAHCRRIEDDWILESCGNLRITLAGSPSGGVESSIRASQTSEVLLMWRETSVRAEFH